MGLMEVFSIPSFIVLFAALTCRLPNILACNIRDAANCPHIDLASEDVWEFIAKEGLDTNCRKLKMALSCALKPEITDGCSPDDTVVFRASNAFVKVICDTHRYAYLRGVDCFMQEDVKDFAQECKRGFRRMTRRDPCGRNAVTDTRECFREELTGTGCTAQDSNLLGYLADAYLMPYNDKYDCEWDSSVEVGPLATPTTVRVETTTTMTTTPSTTASTTARTTGKSGTGSTDSEKMGRVRGASSRLTAASGALWGALLTFLLFV